MISELDVKNRSKPKYLVNAFNSEHNVDGTLSYTNCFTYLKRLQYSAESGQYWHKKKYIWTTYRGI